MTGRYEIQMKFCLFNKTYLFIHVEEAQGSRAPSQQWVDRFAEIYTPIVILIAIAIAVIPPLAFAQSFNIWFYQALVMLVIACPCALVIFTPVPYVAATESVTVTLKRSPFPLK
jgi:Cd2+/Zn2+-exporting ATPase